MTCGARGSGYFRKSAWTTSGAGRGARREPRRATGVDLDGRQRSAEFLQCTRERAVAGADFDDGSIGASDDLHDDGDDAAIVKKVLAKLSRKWEVPPAGPNEGVTQQLRE